MPRCAGAESGHSSRHQHDSQPDRVLLTAIAQAIIEAVWLGFRFGFRFNDVPIAPVIAVVQDVFAVAVLTGVVMVINRLVVNATRFRGSRRGDAVLNLAWIGTLITSCN